MKPGVSIVIPTWNGIALLERFLPSVTAAASAYASQSSAPVEIVIVDDGSTDETCSFISNLGSEIPDLRFQILKNEENLGFAKTCNRGVKAASHNLVFLLNNDVELDAGAIAPLVENFGDAKTFAAHCRVIELDSGEECGTGKIGGFARGFLRVHQSYIPRAGSVAREPLYSIFAGGGSAMFDRESFLRLGGFEELLSPFYWEDVELSYRAWKRGLKIVYEPRSVARHRVSSTIGKLKRSRVRRIEQRNRLLLHWINLHDRGLMASHMARLILFALTSPLSLAEALRLLPEVRKRRDEEKRAARLSDREVIGVFKELAARADVITYNHREEIDEGGR
ncbi:MAG TPA: glycosyltransferase family 2 protein [Blastocatellia bacterium]|nr:glycosyltransferase family 2 protein [Blastocatellia bacterium]